MRKLCAVAALAALLPALNAQELRSTISGRITDQQGAVVPGVKVAAVQVDTGARTETISGQDGQYTLPFLLPGAYKLSAAADGFKQYLRDGISLNSNERKAIDIQLEVGTVSENVTVTADAPLLETASGSVGQVISPGEVDAIPLNGRTPLAMAALAAGVVPQGGPTLNRPFDNSHTSDLSIAGAPGGTNELLLDGSPNASRTHVSAYSPPMDAVLEMKVEAFQSDAAFGNTGGGTINLVMKAGTNTFHGTAYEYNQVTKLAATPFFLNRSGQPKPLSLWNQYGVTAGAPVFIPKVFNGRDKLFFYFVYEGIKQPSIFPLATTVPTEEMRRGDFSKLLAINSSYQIYDPFSGVREGSRIRRQPYANNTIPSRMLNPIALNYLKYYPMPNQPGGVDGRNNFYTNAPGREDYDNQMGRLDYNLSTMHKLFFNVRHSERYNDSQNYFQNGALGRNLIRHSWGAVLDDVHTFTPTLVLNTRLNWTHYTEIRRLLTTGMDITTLGFADYLAKASPLQVLPRVDIGGFNTLGENNHNFTPFDSFQIFSSFTKIAGKHTVKPGVDLRLYRESNYSPGASAGRYQFKTNWTRGPLDSASSAPLGQDLASFLLGLPTSGNFDLNAFRTNQAGYWALFLQDDWRVTPNLTLNLGVRYEKDTPTTERFNRAVRGFDAAAVTSITAAAKAAYAKAPLAELPVSQFNPVGGLLFAGPDHRSVYETSSTSFSPRFGFAWTPAPKTVVRGGFGMFYFDLGIAATNQTGFSQSTQLVPTQDSYLTPYGTLSNPFPDGIQQPTGAALGANTNLGNGVNYYNPNPLTPYSLRWNLSVQRQLSKDAMVELGYLANHSVHLAVDRQLNFVPTQFLSTSPVRDQATIDWLATPVANPFAGLIPGTSLDSKTVSRSQLLQAFPQFSGVNANAMNDGSSYSHILMLRGEKRFSGGLQLQANVQYSRIMQKLSRLNDSDAFLEKRVAPEDRPFRAVLSGSYALPLARGNRFLGGWIVSGIYTRQSGAPLEWGNVIYYGGDLQMAPTNIDRAFDTTRFNTNSKQQLAQNVRTFPTAFSNLRAAGPDNVDLSIIKDFRIRERLKMQYRCEFFNAFNHPMFDVPDISPTSSTFGQIQNQANLPRRVQMALRLVW